MVILFYWCVQARIWGDKSLVFELYSACCLTNNKKNPVVNEEVYL